MRYLVGLVLLFAQGIMGCNQSSRECGGLDLYGCVDDTACTPAFAPAYAGAYETCIDMSEPDCAKRVELLPPEGREFFCMQVRQRDGRVRYAYFPVCTEDSECSDGQECFRLEPDAPWGECTAACPENECTNDADCLEGYVCYPEVACGDSFVRLLGHGWDEMRTLCIPMGAGGMSGDGGSAGVGGDVGALEVQP